MNLVLVAHGTRRPGGVEMIGDLAARVSTLLGHRVQVAFVDVLGPTPSEVLSRDPSLCGPAIVVPAFLSRGYHVRTDLPTHVAASGHPDVTVTPALGPSQDIVRIVAEQLVKSGWRRGDSVDSGGRRHVGPTSAGRPAYHRRAAVDHAPLPRGAGICGHR